MFTSVMEVPAAKVMDEPGPQRQALAEALDSGFGSMGSTISVKGKEHAIAPIITPQAVLPTSTFCNQACPSTSSVGKWSHSDMTGDDAVSINMSSTTPSPACHNLLALQPTKKEPYSSNGHCHHFPPPSHKSASAWQSHAAESLMLGMQGSLNFLTLSLNNLDITAEDKVSACRAVALTMLQEQDGDLPKDIKAFFRAMIVHNVGFTDVYMLTANKDECTEFIRVEVEGMQIKLVAKELLPVALTIPNPF
ncbi:hypothetical protein PAXRUDRAFT_9149 [Paxillus rubicundulus Ve08.2h10]|uniref:Uncharacterized protein n=1 Tax=Paxillus rubicundulus Ve08.2h10 TaxID=930991 RepID=A0A0D0DKN4_9AGAM|nr:hypothetical protein PAXRUDRAFT_9149 [Paxillus rubicundulus Ve08.2h10]